MRKVRGAFLLSLFVGCVAPERQIPTTSSPPIRLQPQSPPTYEDAAEVQPRSGGRATPVDVLALLEGARVVASDGQFLGVLTQNEFNSDSILNEFGRYGGEFSRTSIFNEFGRYGGEFSSLSPFNEFTSTPPTIISSQGEFLGYLTKNQFKAPAVDPQVVIALLRGRR